MRILQGCGEVIYLDPKNSHGDSVQHEGAGECLLRTPALASCLIHASTCLAQGDEEGAAALLRDQWRLLNKRKGRLLTRR